MKIGMIFPGQGSQFVGMGKEFYDNERIFQELFEEASSCLNVNFTRLCFASSEAELMGTINAQTSIFLISCATAKLLEEKYKIVSNIVAGHSLGEYSAIFTAGGFSFPDGIYLLMKRALFMEEATNDENSGMIAVLNCSQSQLQEIVSRNDVPGSDESVVEIVNFNSPNQLVVSGTLKELEKVSSDITLVGGKSIPLKVAGAFHSRLMKKAQEKFSAYLSKVNFKDLSVPLVSNVDAKEIKTADEISFELVKQIASPVQWWPSMQRFADCDLIIEVGPSGKFAKMLSREWKDKKIISVASPKDIENLLQLI
ncbi:TPA: [acyl-carrier-protein] S-malonyltransferase [Candidatus Dependentiae bacterium]|nr:MAG: Malonyl CoA-acyl carrier protein transacylase [candidate division TM6 bacterium GW2011_GWF2_33_332]HBS48117.1 [acyl-carrier-protein] S-malonyltransferase [Candidatus Dependentiae bacterium]HBZ73541.1 [acyl-carrier-protein] S-malonyltransferase [Candidatus Dependentiae bacterium]